MLRTLFLACMAFSFCFLEAQEPFLISAQGRKRVSVRPQAGAPPGESSTLRVQSTHFTKKAFERIQSASKLSKESLQGLKLELFDCESDTSWVFKNTPNAFSSIVLENCKLPDAFHGFSQALVELSLDGDRAQHARDLPLDRAPQLESLQLVNIRIDSLGAMWPEALAYLSLYGCCELQVLPGPFPQSLTTLSLVGGRLTQVPDLDPESTLDWVCFGDLNVEQLPCIPGTCIEKAIFFSLPQLKCLPALPQTVHKLILMDIPKEAILNAPFPKHITSLSLFGCGIKEEDLRMKLQEIDVNQVKLKNNFDKQTPHKINILKKPQKKQRCFRGKEQPILIHHEPGDGKTQPAQELDRNNGPKASTGRRARLRRNKQGIRQPHGGHDPSRPMHPPQYRKAPQ